MPGSISPRISGTSPASNNGAQHLPATRSCAAWNARRRDRDKEDANAPDHCCRIDGCNLLGAHRRACTGSNCYRYDHAHLQPVPEVRSRPTGYYRRLDERLFQFRTKRERSQRDLSRKEPSRGQRLLQAPQKRNAYERHSKERPLTHQARILLHTQYDDLQLTAAEI